MTAPIRVGVLHDMAASMEEEESLGGTREAIMRLAVDDLRRARATRPRRRVRPRCGAGTSHGHRVRGRAGLRRPRRAGRGADRGPGDRRQRTGRDAARGPGADADDQLGRHRARSERIHVPPPGRLARGRIGAPRSSRRGDSARNGWVSCSTARRSAGATRRSSRPSARRSDSTSPHAGVDRPAGGGRDEGSRLGPHVRRRRARVPRARSRRHCRCSRPHRRRMGRARGDEHGRTPRSRPRVRACDRRLGVPRHDRRRQPGARRRPWASRCRRRARGVVRRPSATTSGS